MGIPCAACESRLGTRGVTIGFHSLGFDRMTWCFDDFFGVLSLRLCISRAAELWKLAKVYTVVDSG